MKALLLLLAGILLVYSLLGLAVDWNSLSQSLRDIPFWLWSVSCLAVAIGHGILFVRWQFLLRVLGYALAIRASAKIYVAGLSLIATPARSGEAIRALWLKQRHQIPMRIGVTITAAERLLDLASAILVLAWGLGLSMHRVGLAISLLAIATLPWTISHPTMLKKAEQAVMGLQINRLWHGLHRVIWEGIQALKDLRRLIHPSTLAITMTLTTTVWILESKALELILQQLGANIALQPASVIRTATSLGGIISFMPGGLGTGDLTSIGLGMMYGASKEQAFAATAIIRITTLFLPLTVGFIQAALNQNNAKNR